MNTIASLPPGLKIYTLVLLSLATLGCWLFVVLYHRKYRWWKNEFGRHLVGFTACLGLLLVYFLVLAFWPTMPWRTPIRTVLFSLFVVVIWWRLVLFGRISQAIDHQDKDGDDGR